MVPMKQLNLFAELENDIKNQKVTDMANGLLNLLNKDIKDKYYPAYHIQKGNLIVLAVRNKEKDIQFNVIDLEGNIPKGFCVCWRNYECI